MHHAERGVDKKFFLRSLAPSLASGAYSFLAGIFLVGWQMASIALGGKSLETPLHDAILQSYNKYLHDPLDNVLHNNPLNSVLLVVLWGMFAWLAFELVTQAIKAFGQWRAVKQEVALPGGVEGFATPHPQRHGFLIKLVWQAFVLLIALAFTLAIRSAVHFIAVNSQHALHASPSSMTVHIGVNVFIWMIIFHCYVILLRWYMLRTRVFGEILLV